MHSQVHITQHETQQKCSESETVMAQFSMSVLWVAIKLKAIRACKHIIKMLALSLVERNEGREEEGAKAAPKRQVGQSARFGVHQEHFLAVLGGVWRA